MQRRHNATGVLLSLPRSSRHSACAPRRRPFTAQLSAPSRAALQLSEPLRRLPLLRCLSRLQLLPPARRSPKSLRQSTPLPASAAACMRSTGKRAACVNLSCSASLPSAFLRAAFVVIAAAAPSPGTTRAAERSEAPSRRSDPKSRTRGTERALQCPVDLPWAPTNLRLNG